MIDHDMFSVRISGVDIIQLLSSHCQLTVSEDEEKRPGIKVWLYKVLLTCMAGRVGC